MNNISGIVRATMLDDNKRNNKSGIIKKIDTSATLPSGTGINSIKSTITNISNSPIVIVPSGSSITGSLGTYSILNNALYNGNIIVPNGYYYINLPSISALPSSPPPIWKVGNVIYNITNGIPAYPTSGDFYLDNISQPNKMYTIADGVGTTSIKTTDSNYYKLINNKGFYNIYDINGSGNVVIATLNNPLLLDDGNVYSSDGTTTFIENGHLVDTTNGNYYNKNNIVDKIRFGDNIDLVYNNTYSKYLCIQDNPNYTYKILNYS